LHCIFRVFTISHDPMSDSEDFLDMAITKLSEGGSSPILGGCYQLLLAPLPKIANCCGIALGRE
jgi:hypothetical protein